MMTAQDVYTIGIDSGSHFCGVAVYKNGKYMTSDVAEFPGVFSLVKFREICLYFQSLFKKYQPQIVVIEEPLAVRNGKVTRMLNLLGGAIFALASEYTDTVDLLHNKTVKKIMGIPMGHAGAKAASVEKAREICGKCDLKDDESDAILLVETYINLMSKIDPM